MIFFILLNILFSQKSTIENTSAIEYKVNNIGIIGLDSMKGRFVYPKNSKNNFIYSIGLIFSGKNSTNNEIFNSYSINNDRIFKSGMGKEDLTEKYNLYQSKYFDKVSGESFLNEYNYPLFNYSNDKPGIYVDDNSNRKLGNYTSVFIQSNNDLFSVFSDSSNGLLLTYHQRILNFTNAPYIIVETKVINRNNLDLTDCYFSPYLDPDLSEVGKEFENIRNDDGIVVDENMLFYTTYFSTPYYLGFRYLQKNLIKDGNYVIKKNYQFNEVNYNILSPDIVLNQSSIYHQLQRKNSLESNTDVRAIAGIGKFDLKANDTLVVTYTIAIAKSIEEKPSDDISNMTNILDLLNNIETLYYENIFDYALSVKFDKIKDNQEIIFDLDRSEFIDIEKINSLKIGKYLILRKKEYKFELIKKIQIE